MVCRISPRETRGYRSKNACEDMRRICMATANVGFNVGHMLELLGGRGSWGVAFRVAGARDDFDISREGGMGQRSLLGLHFRGPAVVAIPVDGYVLDIKEAAVGYLAPRVGDRGHQPGRRFAKDLHGLKGLCASTSAKCQIPWLLLTVFVIWATQFGRRIDETEELLTDNPILIERTEGVKEWELHPQPTP
ncbi:hypothetical protein BJ875DRAFT_445611 [Amylocarpus encephaloides]|uniref:Uncharacterized protein n=1 Tax=Amylocarpus encephaloides TaxID=45428 RepID=A0A9P7Y9X6_9HELO|nr:hypothetical protein BJ875DRAFT_445611 [Amylocarpus encephaloides]